MQKWLPVAITNGLFPSERVAALRTPDGDVSIFVHVSHLDLVFAVMRVTILDEDAQHALIHIPAQSGEMTVRVHKGQLWPEGFKPAGIQMPDGFLKLSDFAFVRPDFAGFSDGRPWEVDTDTERVELLRTAMLADAPKLTEMRIQCARDGHVDGRCSKNREGAVPGCEAYAKRHADAAPSEERTLPIISLVPA